MSAADFYQARDDRSMRYAGRVLAFDRRLALSASAEYLARPEGQAALLTAANLLARMARRVVLALPTVALDPRLRQGDGPVHARCLAVMQGADPHGGFSHGAIEPADYVIRLGPDGHGWVAHGSDWNMYVGPAPSPLPPPQTDNILGAVFAAITAVARVFSDWYPEEVGPFVANLLTNEPAATERSDYLAPGAELGSLWLLGAGSVGSALAYFLSMLGLGFDATVFDMDEVKVENLDRSPVFTIEDAVERRPKASVVADFLTVRGLKARAEPTALDESPLWTARSAGGAPDVMVSAANERDVRYAVESQFPPVQVYATTGRQWQTTVLRHVPPQDPCSCCLFPPKAPVTDCAKGKVPSGPGADDQVDAALPFLSFAAGVMAVAELVKLTLCGAPVSANRAFFTPCAEEVLFSRAQVHRPDCLCHGRSRTVHRKMIAGTRFAGMSVF